MVPEKAALLSGRNLTAETVSYNTRSDCWCPLLVYPADIPLLSFCVRPVVVRNAAAALLTVLPKYSTETEAALEQRILMREKFEIQNVNLTLLQPAKSSETSRNRSAASLMQLSRFASRGEYLEAKCSSAAGEKQHFRCRNRSATTTSGLSISRDHSVVAPHTALTCCDVTLISHFILRECICLLHISQQVMGPSRGMMRW